MAALGTLAEITRGEEGVFRTEYTPPAPNPFYDPPGWDRYGLQNIVNKKLKETTKMAEANSEDLRAARKLDAVHYRLYKAGLVDADGDATRSGNNLLEEILFEENIDKVIAVLDKQDSNVQSATDEQAA